MKEQDDLSPYVKRMHNQISLEEFDAAEASIQAEANPIIIAVGPIVLTENHWSMIVRPFTEAHSALSQLIRPTNNDTTHPSE